MAGLRADVRVLLPEPIVPARRLVRRTSSRPARGVGLPFCLDAIEKLHRLAALMARPVGVWIKKATCRATAGASIDGWCMIARLVRGLREPDSRGWRLGCRLRVGWA
jgi:hypothetical protein